MRRTASASRRFNCLNHHRSFMIIIRSSEWRGEGVAKCEERVSRNHRAARPRRSQPDPRPPQLAPHAQRIPAKVTERLRTRAGASPRRSRSCSQRKTIGSAVRARRKFHPARSPTSVSELKAMPTPQHAMLRVRASFSRVSDAVSAPSDRVRGIC